MALVCGLLLLVSGCGEEQASELNAEMGPSAASPTPDSDPLAGAPTEGSCYRLNDSQINAPTSSRKPLSDCYSRHNTYTYLVGMFPEGTTSSDTQRVQNQCQKHLATATGLTQDELVGTVLEWIWFEPTTKQWSAGARWFRCDMVARLNDETFRLPETTYLTNEFTDGIPDQYARCITPGPDTDGDGHEDAKYLTCDKPHQYRFAGSFEGKGTKYPGEKALQAMTDERCAELTQTNQWWATWPRQTYWESGHRRMSCYKMSSS
ncbi:hypothetical protein ncot_12365 [Nocardioides sp. JQ2195]|uniref:septum formation family protein n=1 Tax=Nocardioides sp. JQ2195 TaxID=2592334 RepID=UPI00143E66A5|nr:septum formation family protein [Nocardioides sp. JQ2195]QIX27306.1 hypothetical protein ncot_12365 [Nocardioides sp. JQ2195]